MDTITRPFDVDELESINRMMTAGISQDCAEGTILTIREGSKMSHCTQEAEKRMKGKASQKKVAQTV